MTCFHEFDEFFKVAEGFGKQRYCFMIRCGYCDHIALDIFTKSFRAVDTLTVVPRGEHKGLMLLDR